MAPCPYCGKANQFSSTFCIHCGEPLDADSLADLSSTSAAEATDTVPHKGGTTSAAIPGRRLEVVLGVGLVLAVLLFAIYSYVKQETDAGHFRAGTDARRDGNLERAMAEFAAAGDYLDSARRLSDTRALIDKRDHLYAQATQDASAGRWWKVSSGLQDLMAIQSNFRDTGRLLQQARQFNGLIVYRMGPWADGQDGIYTAWSDGGTPHRLPNSDSLSFVHAVSRDGLWVVYSLPTAGRKRTVYLYNTQNERVSELYLPSTVSAIPLSAKFDRDQTSVWLDADDTSYEFSLDIARYTETLFSARNVPRGAHNLESLRLIGLQPAANEATNVMLSDYRGENTIKIATETGKVDGALFSPDERFLMHHSCEPVGPRLGLRCSLRLTDLQSPTPEAMLLGTMPMRRYGDTRNGLLAQFTRDSKYIMLLERYNGEREVHLYDIAAGSSIRLPWATGEGGFADIDQSPLIPGLSRGLAQWSGENVLANTDRTVDLSRAQGGQDSAIGYQLVRGHWAEVSPGGQYLVYLGGQDVSPGAGDYRVYSVPLAPSGRILGQFEPPVMLLRTTVRPSEWRQSNYLLPDGHTLMTIAAPNPGAARGLYAYDLDTAESRLITAGATELWSPGFSQPLQDDLLR